MAHVSLVNELDALSKEDKNIFDTVDWNNLADKCFSVANKHSFIDHEIVFSLVESEEIQRLNLEFREKDSVTDVLSFNAAEMDFDYSELESEYDDDIEVNKILGDIVVCLERARKQASENFPDSSADDALEQELKFLFVHGLLHLLGYDHENPEEEKRMFSLQDEVLT